MKILAIDTTSTSASIALLEDEKILGSYRISTLKKHSETLLPMIEHLCSTTASPLSSLNAFAVTTGPGSFTGVRIGVSTIKGLAFATNLPCIAVSTLEALAWNLKGIHGIIVCVMDARRNQFYNAVFRNDENGCHRITTDRMISSKELQEELLSSYSDEKIYFVGDGYDLARKTVHCNACDTPPILRLQNAESIAMLANIQLQENRAVFTDQTIAPYYLRPSQAERERAEKNSNQEKENHL